MEKKTVLLTGAAGFIGFHTARSLLEMGDRVVGIDNINDYYDPSIKHARLDILRRYPGFRFYRQNVEDEIKIKEKPDTLCHLAAQAGVRYSLENPFAYEKSNMLGTLNMLEFARNNGIENMVFASSSSVYGGIKEPMFTESQKTDTPLSLYAATKKANELYAHAYHNLFGINMIGLRFFTVYGPWGRPDMALFKFTKSISEGNPIDVYNNGKMKRDFTYVDDIVRGTVSAIDKVGKVKFGIFNLGRGKQERLLDFIAEIEKNLGKKAVKNFLPMQPGDVPESLADISQARSVLGYEPLTSIGEGINRFIEWYKSYYK